MRARSLFSRLQPAPAMTFGFVLLSALYFTDTLLRTTLKTFWYDELFTVYLCRLPSFHSTWAAVLHGSDFNPPLFYLLTRASEHFLGEGLISTRLPSIFGFWIFGICLYNFSSRRLGRLSGCVAAVLPVFTLAHAYAYEARPHGLLLGWCGLMLLCWQRAGEQSKQSPRETHLWSLGLGVCFLAALLTHVYAIYLATPFLLSEGLLLLKRRRLNAAVLAGLLLPPLAVAPLYVRMSYTFKSMNPAVGIPLDSHLLLQHYLLSTFSPGLILVLVAAAIGGWGSSFQGADAHLDTHPSLTRAELVVAIGFLLLPIFGVIGVRISHGPYFERYFLASTAGLALLLAQLSSGRRSWIAPRLLAAMLLLLSGDVLLAVRAHLAGSDLVQVEPASGFKFSPSPLRPLQRDGALLRDTSGLDILVTQDHNYLFLNFYAPPQIRKRLIFGAPKANDFSLLGDRRLAQWADVDLTTATYDEFFSTHHDFLVYGSADGRFNGDCYDCIQKFLTAGYTLRSITRDDDNLLEHFSR